MERKDIHTHYGAIFVNFFFQVDIDLCSIFRADKFFSFSIITDPRRSSKPSFLLPLFILLTNFISRHFFLFFFFVWWDTFVRLTKERDERDEMSCLGGATLSFHRRAFNDDKYFFWQTKILILRRKIKKFFFRRRSIS